MFLNQVAQPWGNWFETKSLAKAESNSEITYSVYILANYTLYAIMFLHQELDHYTFKLVWANGLPCNDE